jgi:hypothetical protein
VTILLNEATEDAMYRFEYAGEPLDRVKDALRHHQGMVDKGFEQIRREVSEKKK